MKLALLYLKSRDEPLGAAEFAGYINRLKGRRYPQPAAPPRDFSERYTISKLQVAGRPLFKLVPLAGASKATILYLHGGGFVHPLQRTHWGIADSLSRATGATLFVPAYPLAPEHDHRAAWPFLRAVHERVLQDSHSEDLTIAGDSAGGGLALGHALRLRDAGAALPARLILFSPWVDLSLNDPDLEAADAADPMLSLDHLRAIAPWWAGPDDLAAPAVSPLFASLSGLPPVHIFQGERDILAGSSRRLAARLQSAGAPTEYVEYPGAFHVHVTAGFTPEAKHTLRRVADAVDP